MNSKNLIIYVILIVVLFVAGTFVISMLKPKMHPTFSIEKLIIKKINK